MRDEVVDYVRHWSDKTGVKATKMVKWIGIARSKYYHWRDRYGKVNEHNACTVQSGISHLKTSWKAEPRRSIPHEMPSSPLREKLAKPKEKHRNGKKLDKNRTTDKNVIGW